MYPLKNIEKLSIKKISLETGAGEFFKPARELFVLCGFKVCKPFAHYKEDINSSAIFFDLPKYFILSQLCNLVKSNV